MPFESGPDDWGKPHPKLVGREFDFSGDTFDNEPFGDAVGRDFGREAARAKKMKSRGAR